MRKRYGLASPLVAAFCAACAWPTLAQSAPATASGGLDNISVAEAIVARTCPRLVDGTLSPDQVEAELGRVARLVSADGAPRDAWTATIEQGVPGRNVSFQLKDGVCTIAVGAHPSRMAFVGKVLVYLSKNEGYTLSNARLDVDNPIYVFTRPIENSSNALRYMVVYNDSTVSISHSVVPAQ